MRMEPTQTSKKSTGFYLAIASLSVGWLIGLSVSPVVNIIVSSVIVILVSTVTLLGGLNISDEQKTKIPVKGSVQTLPLAILTLFIAIGASIGIYARTHEWLGKKKESISANTTVAASEDIRPDQVAALYAITVEDCDLLRLKTGKELRKAFLNLQNDNIDNILTECTSDSCLNHLKNILCASAK